jgi:hypothetical protein
VNRLNFGCGSIRPADWVNVDRDDYGQGHLGSTELFGDGEFELVVAQCVLQLTPLDDIGRLLGELHRILCRRGLLRLSLPDIEAGFTAYQAGDIGWFPNGEADLDDRFSNWLTWYSTTRSLFTPSAICARLREAGFGQVWRTTYGQSLPIRDGDGALLDTREGECFFIEALK